MYLLIPAILLLAVIVGPQLWVKAVMARYSKPREDFPGTGGELARHLLDRGGMHEVRVEAAERGDHYDPRDKAVRLTPDKLDGRSLTAVAVAAHEVGHAIQDHIGYTPLRLRHRLVELATPIQQVGSVMMMAAPVVLGVSRSPIALLVVLLAGVATMGMGAVTHLVTLPVEFDASFKRALPILRDGQYLHGRDLRAARRVLRAAALTYVAGALMGLLSLRYWMRMLRR